MITTKTGQKKKKPRTGNEMVNIKGRWLPRYAYRATDKGTWREDRKTGKLVWRKLGNDFPAK